MKQLYKKDYKDTIESLSKCWGMQSILYFQSNTIQQYICIDITHTANKWFLGCEYPRGVHAIIDEWPAPRKEDVDQTLKLPEYENVIENTRTINKPITDNSNGNESENEDIDLDLTTQNTNNNNTSLTNPPNTTNNNLSIGRKRNFNELNNGDQNYENYNNQNPENSINPMSNMNHPTKKLKLSQAANDGNHQNHLKNNDFIQNDSISNKNNLTPHISNNNNNNSMLPISNNVNNNINLDKKPKKSKTKKSKRPRWG